MEEYNNQNYCLFDCCTRCSEDFYELTDMLVKDIKHLEAKVVFLRHTLSKYLPEYEGEMLRCDIFSDLARRYWFHNAYMRYIVAYHRGKDPMESKRQTNIMMKISRGEKSVNL